MEDTYVSTDYYSNQNELVFEPMEEYNVAPEKRWALGVIYYYLVTGYPALNEDHKVNFYEEIGLGPKLHSSAMNKLISDGHSFPSKSWQDLLKEVRECIKGLTCYHPGNRTCTDDIGFHSLPRNKMMDSNFDEGTKSNCDDSAPEQKNTMDGKKDHEKDDVQ